MNRVQKKRGFSLSQLTLPASILIFLLIFLLFYKGVGSVSQTASEQQMENLQQAIRRSAVHCYAVEGSYPESLDYLKEHAPSVMSPILCTELTDNQKISLLKEGEIEKGEPLFAVNIYE